MSEEKKSSKPWLAITLAAIAALGAPLVGFTVKIYEVERSLQSGGVYDIKENLEATGKLYSQLYIAASKAGADRSVLFRAHDSGGVIPSRSTIVAEVSLSGDSAYMGWQSQPLDKQHVDLLSDLAQNQKSFLVTESMDTSILRDNFEVNGTESAYFALVGSSKGELYYVAMMWGDPFDQPTAQHRNEARSVVNTLSKILRSLRIID